MPVFYHGMGYDGAGSLRYQEDSDPAPSIPAVRYPASWFLFLGVGIGGLEPGE